MLADGILVDIKWIRAFIMTDMVMPIRLVLKVTKTHLDPNNIQKMNVSLATQLLSNTVGAVVQSHAALGLLPPQAMATGKFCQDVNDFF